MEQEGFYHLLDLLESGDVQDPARFFDQMRRTFGLANLLYLDAVLSPSGLRVHRLHHTFPAGCERLYRQRGHHRIDPVLRRALTGVRPVDWAEMRALHPESEPLYRDAEAIGIVPQGLAFPLPSRGSRCTMLAVNAALDDGEWAEYRRAHLRDFQTLAGLFHAGIRDADQQPARTDARLTARESEALGWVAAGKSYWETAQILGISERTVRFFMTNVRRKLDVASNSQAVAQAAWHGLIPDHIYQR